MQPTVYIVTGHRSSGFVVGASAAPVMRIHRHREGLAPVLPEPQPLSRLVWFEHHRTMADAERRLRQLRSWGLAWVLALIAAANPHWRDLWNDLLAACGAEPGACPAFSAALPSPRPAPSPPARS